MLGFVNEDTVSLQTKNRKRPLAGAADNNNGANKRRPNENCRLPKLDATENNSLDKADESSVKKHEFEILTPVVEPLLDPAEFSTFPDPQLITDDMDLRDLQVDQLGLENNPGIKLLH